MASFATSTAAGILEKKDMLKSKSFALWMVTGFSVATLIALPCYGQQDCHSCNQGVQTGFGYPMAAGHAEGFGGQHNWRKERRAEWKLEADKIYQRNKAWPKPFNCLDQMAYHAIFPAMIHAGYETQCVLGNQHFDPETQELNSLGKSTVANIMQNMPSHRKHVFVSQHLNDRVTAQRIEEVNQLVSTYYGQIAPNAIVSASSMQPGLMSGVRAEAIVRGFTESAPAPVVPLQTSGTSIERSQNR